jgi:hypothetical protein
MLLDTDATLVQLEGCDWSCAAGFPQALQGVAVCANIQPIAPQTATAVAEFSCMLLPPCHVSLAAQVREALARVQAGLLAAEPALEGCLLERLVWLC